MPCPCPADGFRGKARALISCIVALRWYVAHFVLETCIHPAAPHIVCRIGYDFMRKPGVSTDACAHQLIPEQDHGLV